MQGDTFDVQADALLMKFRRPIAGTNFPQIWEKRIVPRQIPENFSHFVVEPHNGGRTRLSPREADHVLIPINILGLQASQVGL